MTPQEVIDYYGDKLRAAVALERDPTTIQRWIDAEEIPLNAQWEIQGRTNRKLRADLHNGGKP